MNQYSEAGNLSLKPQSSNLKPFILGIVIHAGLLWVALVLGYNSYKEFEPLPKIVKASIKATFPWAILIFSGIYFAVSFMKNIKSIFLNVWQYVYVIISYAILLNLFFFSKGKNVFIPLNLSVLYFLILLTILLGLSRIFYFENLTSNLQPLTSKVQDYLPPIVHRFLITNKAQAYVREKPSAPFIIAFMVLLIICAFLLILKAEEAAEQLANIAYFSLVIGVGIEVYQLMKGKTEGNDEGKDSELR